MIVMFIAFYRSQRCHEEQELVRPSSFFIIIVIIIILFQQTAKAVHLSRFSHSRIHSNVTTVVVKGLWLEDKDLSVYANWTASTL